MEVNKKPKRPRIKESQAFDVDNGHFEKVTYTPGASSFSSEKAQTSDDTSSQGGESRTGTSGDYREQSQRSYSQGGYSNYGNRQQGGYNRQGGYGNNYGNSYGNRQQGGYGNNRQQSGYGNRQQGGYNQQGGYGNRQQGGYNQQGGYGNRQQGNYGNSYGNRQQGGYNQQGGYGNRQQGNYGNGYGNRQQGGYNQQGGYGNRQQGNYGNSYGNRQQGGYGNSYGNRPQQNRMHKSQAPVRKAGKRFTPRPQPVVYDVPVVDPNEEIRLNKFMANAGVCSRREADELIQKGEVKVNGVAVTELGTKIKHSDVVEYDGKVVTLENKCYILLNKPKDCVTTSDDPDGRLTVMDIVKDACKERIYPVGRLDRNTTGVLLLTNDGDLASKLTHPKYVKKKIYQVWTDKDISEEDMQRLADGIELEDGPIHADAISYVNDRDKNQAGIEIHSGRNRIVRRMFESLGYRVTKLDRVYFAGLTKKNLPRGRWRYLTQEEVNFLKQGSFE